MLSFSIIMKCKIISLQAIKNVMQICKSHVHASPSPVLSFGANFCAIYPEIYIEKLHVSARPAKQHDCETPAAIGREQ